MTERIETIAEGVTLHLGDCRDVLPTLAADAIVSDPPYGIAHRRGSAGNRGKGITRGTSGIQGDDETFSPAHLLRFPCLLWGANHYSMSLQGGRWLIWDKTLGGGSGDFSDFEMAWLSRPGAAKIYRHLWMGVQRESQVGETRQHPTEKPVALMEWCIGFFPGARVIADPYMGSGTTGIAAVRLGREFYGIERDPAHFETACSRVSAALKQADLFIEKPKPAVQLGLLESVRTGQ